MKTEGSALSATLRSSRDVLGQEDFSHSAPAELADDLVRPDAPPDRRLIAVIVHQPLFLLKIGESMKLPSRS